MTSKFLGERPAMRLSRFFLILVAVLFLALPATAYAAEITYIGDGKNLQRSPAWFDDESASSFFLGTTAAPLSSDNKVIIDYDPTATVVTHPEVVFGGLSESGNVSGNNVTLLNGQVQDSLLGGFCHDGDVANNTITVSGGSVGWHVFGGFSDKGSSTGNTVIINGGSMAEDVDGGYSDNGDIMGNTVTINGGSIGGDVSGGWSGSSGVAADNRITISDGSVAKDVVGGYSEKGSVAGNVVTIKGGLIRGSASGGWSDNRGSATNNRINISGGSVAGGVCGGCSFDGEASGNKIFIGGGLVSGDVDGGYSEKGSAARNAIIISGGAISGEVSGGWSEDKNATDNIITISGRPDLAKARISGGYTEDLLGDNFTGNTLNLKSSGTSVASVGNFEYYNFDLPKNLASGGVMLSVADKVNLAKATVGILLQDGVKLKKGDKIALIRSAKDVILNMPKNKDCQVQQGGSLYEFSIYTDSNNLWAEVTKTSRAAK